MIDKVRTSVIEALNIMLYLFVYLFTQSGTAAGLRDWYVTVGAQGYGTDRFMFAASAPGRATRQTNDGRRRQIRLQQVREQAGGDGHSEMSTRGLKS